MKERLSHRERIETIINGGIPDHPAISIWRHFYHLESKAEGLARAMIDFQNNYNWDFMKINPRASYHVEDWGNKLEWSNNEFQKHRKTYFSIQKIEDWEKIEPLSFKAPVLSEHLKAISLIRKQFDRNLPIMMTVFNPISIAADLLPHAKILLEHLHINPKRVLQAMENITQTFEKYVIECFNAGADGIFFATTEFASNDMMPYSQYAEFARPYDLRILKAANSGMNILHVCGSNNFLNELSDYPVKFLNWDSSDPTNINLDKALKIFHDKTIIGGIDHNGWLIHSTPQEISSQMSYLAEQYSNQKIIFGPGCAIDPKVATENLAALKSRIA
jgi:uroporphyrinogen decarboxylase